MKKLIVLVLALVMCLSLASCGSSSKPAVSSSSSKKSSVKSASSANASSGTKKTEGDLGTYHIKFTGASIGPKDYDGNSTVIINYNFTNNSDKSAEADIELEIKAFQDGVELESAYLENSSTYNGDNESKEIKPGITLKCQTAFVTSGTSNVEVEASELISLSDSKVVSTYSISK